MSMGNHPLLIGDTNDSNGYVSIVMLAFGGVNNDILAILSNPFGMVSSRDPFKGES